MYVHANAGCRLEALSVLGPCLQMGFQVIALDCAGSGLSGGEHTTLGWRERDDVRAVNRCGGLRASDVVGAQHGRGDGVVVRTTRIPLTALILIRPSSRYASSRWTRSNRPSVTELNGAARVASIEGVATGKGHGMRRALVLISTSVDIEKHPWRMCVSYIGTVRAGRRAGASRDIPTLVHAALPHAELCVCPGARRAAWKVCPSA